MNQPRARPLVSGRIAVQLSGLYGRAAQLRRAWYARHPHRRRRLAQPVISVGNLVIGGSGKTPVVAAIARLLIERGEHPAILSRGYGRRQGADGVVVVSDGRQVLQPASVSGDEPQMLARALPTVVVAVAADRHLAGRLAERRFHRTVHLLDDGFQHLSLARDVELLVMSPSDLDERLLPAGRLREGLEAARAADAVLVAGTDEEAAAVARDVGVQRAFRLTRHYGAPQLVEPFGAALPGEAVGRAVAFAGIARPERFFSALREQGWDVVRELTFRDHRWFTARDVERIRRAAVESGADLVITTEKDAVRWREPVARPTVGGVFGFLPMHVSIDAPDRFAAWLGERLASARARRPPEAA
ncbi:MAG: tetraacyldisaccharide 4'-kinase [Acidobacteria bacterium]|nr:tetraacyldisaccharide 4'-kinase [Acidobacteriota bacterium]